MLKNSSAASRLGSTAIYHQFHFWNRMLEISCMFWTEIFKIFAVKLSFCLPCPQIVSHGISWPKKKKVKNTWLRNKIIVLIRGNNFSIFLFKVLWLLSSIFPKYEKKNTKFQINSDASRIFMNFYSRKYLLVFEWIFSKISICTHCIVIYMSFIKK